MNAPTKSDLQAAGYRVSVNIADAVVARCASEVKAAYLLAYVSEAEITASAGTDSIGEAWRTLTVLRIMQDNEFATRLGGEKKKLSYGDHLTDKRQAKTRAAMAMDALAAEHPATGEVRDICEVWFRTQLML
jgi:hypothetical protein